MIAGKLAVGEKTLTSSGIEVPQKTKGFILKTENKLLQHAFKEAVGDNPKEVFVRILPQTKQGIKYVHALVNRGVVFAETDGAEMWAMVAKNGTLCKSATFPLKPETLALIESKQTTIQDVLAKLPESFKAYLPADVKLEDFKVTEMVSVTCQIVLIPTPTVGMNLVECFQQGANNLLKNGANSMLIQHQNVLFTSLGKSTANNFVDALQEMQAYGLPETEGWYALLTYVPKKKGFGKSTWVDVAVTPLNIAKTAEAYQMLQQAAANTKIESNTAFLSATDAPKLIE